jgi:hypothetical protein
MVLGDLWLHQLALEPMQHRGFQLVPPHRQQVLTRSFVAGGGAAAMGLADLREPATACSTLEKT